MLFNVKTFIHLAYIYKTKRAILTWRDLFTHSKYISSVFVTSRKIHFM